MKTRIQSSVKFNSYQIIDRAVEEGVATGYRRAHKHTANPSEKLLKECIYLEVMTSLCGVLDFPGD